jgi:hypothetical protein
VWWGGTGTTLKTPAAAVSAMASQGDPRVLVVLNLVLSGLFSTVVVWGLAFIGIGEFTWPNVAVATVALFVITWVFVMRK